MPRKARKYGHKSVEARMDVLREWAVNARRLPSVREASRVLGLPDLSASGYVQELRRQKLRFKKRQSAA